jgi:amidohydrolase
MMSAAPSSSPFVPSITLRSDVQAINDEIVAWRRAFHAAPELSFQEVQTAADVASILRSFGMTEVFERCGRTGVVGLIRGGGGDGPCILLRADMDALPLQESGSPAVLAGGFVSLTPGVMHACGHDGHMASLLGAAKVLWGMRGSLRGTVKLCFQPAEEGYGGAREMIKDGVLDEGAWGPRVDAVFGAHLWSFGKVGEVGARHGAMMAASDKFSIDVIGKGGHGAAPQSTVDAIVVASHLVTALQTVVSRSKDPLEAGVLTVGMMHGGSGYNIIADKVELNGTCRSFTPETQEIMKARMRDVCCGMGQAFGAQVEMTYTHGYPPTVNTDAPSVEALHASARKIVGGGAGVPFITCGAEDFSYFLLQRPGAFFFVGAALPGELRPHHKSVFDFDETALGVAASVFVQLIEDKLGAP